jgi:hypothetical protein
MISLFIFFGAMSYVAIFEMHACIFELLSEAVEDRNLTVTGITEACSFIVMDYGRGGGIEICGVMRNALIIRKTAFYRTIPKLDPIRKSFYQGCASVLFFYFFFFFF